MTTKPTNLGLLSKSRIQTLEGQTSKVSFAEHHPTLPIIVSSPDGRVCHADIYRLENTLNYALERAWCMVLHRKSHEVAVEFDDGVVVLKPGRDDTVVLDGPFG